jgi:hypothetical protein
MKIDVDVDGADGWRVYRAMRIESLYGRSH